MSSRLKTLVVENFRSIRGKIVIPLDAQVVLIHGTNGMGKTSVLSALELGLTGKVGHLATSGDGYKAYMTTLDTERGSIEITTTEPYKERANTGGAVTFSDTEFLTAPLLETGDAKFFAERCYLPQATLGRLLEIYDDLETSTASPLTQFVKELLGLDPLDALVDGLYPAYNVTRVRNLVPEYRRLESLLGSIREEIKRSDQAIASKSTSFKNRIAELTRIVSDLSPAGPLPLDKSINVENLRDELKRALDEERVLTELSRLRSELKALEQRWLALPAEDSTHDRATKERR